MKFFAFSKDGGQTTERKQRNKATLGELLSYTPDRVPVVAIVVVRGVDIARIDVQVVHVGIIVPSRGPEVAVATQIVLRAIVEVAREGSKGMGTRELWHNNHANPAGRAAQYTQQPQGLVRMI